VNGVKDSAEIESAKADRNVGENEPDADARIEGGFLKSGVWERAGVTVKLPDFETG